MNKVNVVDIETTGFLNKKGLIVEVGIVQLDLEKESIKGLYNSTCREPDFSEKHKGSWIFSNSDLTMKEVMEGPRLEECKEAIQEALDDCDRITAFNKSFDFDFLRSRGFIINNEWDCPMKVSTEVCKIPKTGKGARYGGYKWPTVEEAWRFLFPNYQYSELHRGLDDAKHEAGIVNELFKRGYMK
jgi:DNA polymerase-3 subunit epsilon